MCGSWQFCSRPDGRFDEVCILRTGAAIFDVGLGGRRHVPYGASLRRNRRPELHSVRSECLLLAVVAITYHLRLLFSVVLPTLKNYHDERSVVPFVATSWHPGAEWWARFAWCVLLSQCSFFFASTKLFFFLSCCTLLLYLLACPYSMHF